jgi:predicted metal-dependent peptidase
VLAAEVKAGVVRVAGMVDYSYRRPSRRAESTPSVIMPTLVRPLPDVAIVCDTSGSMSGDLLGRVLVEVEALLQRVGLRGTNVRVLTCDAQVHSVKRVSRASQIELLGGGGTDMGEGITQALALRPRPSIVVVLTDGFTPWPTEAPRGTKVIVGLMEAGRGRAPWVHRTPVPPSWAKVVRISESDSIQTAPDAGLHR